MHGLNIFGLSNKYFTGMYREQSSRFSYFNWHLIPLIMTLHLISINSFVQTIPITIVTITELTPIFQFILWHYWCVDNLGLVPVQRHIYVKGLPMFRDEITSLRHLVTLLARRWWCHTFLVSFKWIVWLIESTFLKKNKFIHWNKTFRKKIDKLMTEKRLIIFVIWRILDDGCLRHWRPHHPCI